MKFIEVNSFVSKKRIFINVSHIVYIKTKNSDETIIETTNQTFFVTETYDVLTQRITEISHHWEF